MVTKILIGDNTRTPLYYLSDLNAFKNGKVYEFKPGVNIVVGENGSGKTTLLNLIKKYLVVDYTECYRGDYNCNINDLFKFCNETMLDGVDVYADYVRNTFRLSHSGEKLMNDGLKTFEEFGALYEQMHSSTGEGVLFAINHLFGYIFGRKVKLMFDYGQFKDVYPLYANYVDKHRVECEDEWTILMDEPDRNLSLDNIEYIKDILSFHKEHTQIIAVIHNPLLIYALAKMEHVHFIELTRGYVKKVKKQVDEIIK